MRILFITSNRIGDAILSTGLLGHLIERHPGAEITIVCGPPAAPLFAALPGLRRIIALPKKWASTHWLDMWRRCVGVRWDLIVNLRRAPLARLLRARRYRVLPATDDSVHRVTLLGRTLGLDPPPAPRLWVTEAHETAAARLLSGHGRVLALTPTANWGGKIWPPERFAELIGRLTAADGILPGASVLVAGGKDEEDMARPVLDAVPARRLINTFDLDLLTTYALFCRCDLFVGNDSGGMHLAAAAGIPTLGLFGPSRDSLYAPWGDRTACVRTTESYAELLADPRFRPDGRETLMGGLSVDAVVAAAEGLWRRVTASA